MIAPTSVNLMESFTNVISSEIVRPATTLLNFEIMTGGVDADLTLSTSSPETPSLLDLAGLGKEIWGDIDAQEYINELRNEWDNP